MFRSVFVIVVGCCSLEASLPCLYKIPSVSSNLRLSQLERIDVKDDIDPELMQAMRDVSPLLSNQTRLLEFGQQFLQFAERFAQSTDHEVEIHPIQILQELRKSGASDEFLFSFMDLFLRMALFVKDPLRVSYEIAFPLIPLGADEPLSRGIPYIPVVSELIHRNVSLLEKGPAVLYVFDECRKFAEEMGDPQLFAWSLEIMRRALPYVAEPAQIGWILASSARILDLLREKDCPQNFLRCIPLAIENNVVRTGSLNTSLEQVVALLEGNVDVLAHMMGLLPGFKLPESSGVLAIVLLSKLKGTFSLASSFFSVLNKRLNEMAGPAPLFGNFVESIINLVIDHLPDIDDELNAAFSLMAAEELLTDWIIPDELENDEEEDISNLLRYAQDEAIEPGQNDQEMAEILDDIFAKGRTSIPLSAYEVLAELLLWICDNPDLYPCSIDALAQNYEFLSPLPFRQRAAFVGAIGHQLRYLYQFLSNRVIPNFKPSAIGSPLDDGE